MTKSVVWTIILVGGFVFLSFFFDADLMREWVSGAVFVGAGLGFYRWFGGAFHVYAAGIDTERRRGVFGLELFLLGEGLTQIYAVAFLNLDRPVWMQVLHLSAFFTFIKLIGLYFLITATRFGDERPLKIGGAAAAIIAFFGVIFTVGGPWLMSKAGAIASAIAHVFSRLG